MPADRAPSPALRWTGALVAGVAGAGGAAFALARLHFNGDVVALLNDPVAVVVAVLPLLTALVAAAVMAAGAQHAGTRVAAKPAGRVAGADGAATSAAPIAPAPGEDAALHLLALLQQEGRFVDFLEENLTPYADDQIGAAVRSIHEGCRAALKDRIDLAPILPGDEGASVTVERGFDPSAIRVTGNVHGDPPYTGVLRHPGWRSRGAIKLPVRSANHDVSILAPAEVEIP